MKKILKPVNILVVDDNPVILKVMRNTLEVLSFPVGEIYEAPDGAEGIRIAEEKDIDVVLLDVNMPDMDGEEMFVRLKQSEKTKDVAVIVISGETDPDKLNSLAKKGLKVIEKPFSVETIEKAIIEEAGKNG